MDRLLGAFAYVALDVVVLIIAARVSVSSMSDGLPRARSFVLLGFVFLPFPFIQFWLLTHELLLQPFVVVAVLAAITYYVSTLFQGAMGLRNVGNEDKIAVTGAMSGREAGIRVIALSFVSLLVLVFVDVVVLRAYFAPYSYPQQFVTTIAVLHFTVRGSLQLLNTILIQLQLSNSYFDDDVRASLTVSQIAGSIGAVYSVFIPLFAFAPSDVRGEALQGVLTSMPAWALFAVYLAAYMLVWLAAFVATSVQHASQNDQFTSWRLRWLTATKDLLDTADEKTRHAEVLSQLALLFRQVLQLKDSIWVAEYANWLMAPHLQEIMDAANASESPAEVVADAQRFIEFCTAKPPQLPRIFEEYSDRIFEWDNRLGHVHALIGYIRRTASYLAGTITPADYAGYIDDALRRETKAAEVPKTTRLRVNTITFVTTTWAAITAVITAYDKLWPSVKGIIHQ